MGRHSMAAVRAMGRCSPLGPMGLVLRTCIISSHTLIRPATRLVRQADWFYRATLFMGRPLEAALGATAACSLSTPMARVLPASIVSISLTATELVRMLD